MSGFEIAGVVLGAIPLIISALENYKAGKGVVATMLKYHGLLDDLIHRLKTQQMFFYIDILQLLREARVAEIANNADPTEEDCVNILRNSRTGREIKVYLGRLYKPFIEILERYESCLKTIAGSLGHLLRRANVCSPARSVVFLI